jgi:anti-anti-sigma factor
MSSSIDLTGDVLSTSSTVGSGKATVVVKGSLDLETTPRFKEFLTKVISEATAAKLQEIVFDTAELYLMSSSAISSFASFLKGIKTLQHRCLIVFRTSATHSWQWRTFEPLRRLAEDIVRVESRG